jgi:hypothetical protein
MPADDALTPGECRVPVCLTFVGVGGAQDSKAVLADRVYREF